MGAHPDQLCINTIRTLAIDAIQRANSGHPGLPMGAAPMAYVLWRRHLHHCPTRPDWPDRDRFVLSPGHGSMLLYALLHLSGYGLTLDDLRAFRQWGSLTPGHPEYGLTTGVETTTGPLGQGAGNAVGMAIAERILAHRFNRPEHTIVDHWTYALVSDGDLMEGVIAEAASLAGHLGLGKLVYLYDDNGITIDGDTSVAFSGEDVAQRFAAYGWEVQVVEDGDHNLHGIDAALTTARREETRPSLIIVKTTIGFGSPNRAGTSSIHGSPLGAEEITRTKAALGWDPEAEFLVPERVKREFEDAAGAGAARAEIWQARFDAWSRAHPELRREWDTAMSGQLPEGWSAALDALDHDSPMATRKASQRALNAASVGVPGLCGGSADLAASVLTRIADAGDFNAEQGSGRNLHFGIREHAMGAIANGMAYHRGVRPYVGTFFVFSDYMRPAVRLAAMCHLPVIYVWSHDSIGVGEDGPTHQPVEQLAALRAIPGLRVIRPADAVETTGAWKVALEHTDGPSALVLTRQQLPILGGSRVDAVARGAYILSDPAENPRVILLATGSEVALASAAAAALAKLGIPARVVSMPCWEIFEAQEAKYRDQVLPPSLRARVAIEAAVSFGWHRWVGDGGRVLALDHFGASAPGKRLFAEFGFSVERVVAEVRKLLA
jgi:transketolase